MKTAKRDQHFMALAHELAASSTERGRRVGAVIVDPDDEVISTGFNRFPQGVDDSPRDRHERTNGEKYFWSSHAERNAIYAAARSGVSTSGCTLYVPWYPCVECAKAIIESGIRELVAYAPDFSEDRWGRQFKKVGQMLQEAGVSVRFIKPLGTLPSGAVS